MAHYCIFCTGNRMSNFTKILALVKKDIMLEMRQQHTFYGLILYIASTVFIIYLALPEAPEAITWQTLFWVIQLFICVNTVAKSFLQDSRGRLLYYYTIASPVQFILAKLIYNICLLLIMNMISILFFYVFLGFPVVNPFIFIFISMLGGISLSLVFTLMSAIAAKAQHNAALIAILGFPVILPLLLLLMRLSKLAFAEIFR